MLKLIKNADVYAPQHEGIRDILICDEKIITVRESIEIEGLETEVYDAEGKTVIPGLIDQHV
ncbi:MAG: beta-aspartyl-peptidase, partial [Solobacterium sp.]|nr:beta-aspartyl-peptidase [Solobacterium sp.]